MTYFIPGFLPAHSSPDNRGDQAWYVVLLDDTQILASDEPQWQPLSHDVWRFSGIIPDEQHHIGSHGDTPCYAVRANPQTPLPPGFRWIPIRQLFAHNAITDTLFEMVGSGLQVFNWDRSHQFCGQCGGATIAHNSERARICQACKIHYYPRISPCIMALITRGEECLLARHTASKGGFFSTLAGFIEPGETIENALRREVAEEVSLSVKNLRYFASQPWPFPGQLMIGFFAEYDQGEIEVDGVEIAEARWWHYSDLPMIPPLASLSGKMIQAFVEQNRSQ